jgi:hypothetical protein
VVAAAAIVLGVFIVWLCAQMAIDPQNRMYLLTIGAGMAGGILALAVGSLRPRRSRWRAHVATPASRLDDRSEQTVRSRPRRRRARVISPARTNSKPAPAPVIDGRISSSGTPPT